jgi:sialate O-acetylesterase
MKLLSRILFLLCAVFAFVFSSSNSTASELELASIFGDNMVLQRDAPITVWGWTEANAAVTVSIKDASATATAGDDGSWRVALPAIGVGDPFEVSVSSGDRSIVLKNVLAGEVWICSGQSNMEWKVAHSGDALNEIANGDHPMIRHIKINNATKMSPQLRAANTGWSVCSTETVGDFTAVGYYFGRRLQKELQVPVGLVNTTWGGTVIEAWIEGKVLRDHPDFADVVRAIEVEAADAEKAAKRAADLEQWKQRADAAVASPPENYHPIDFDDSDWKTIPVPAHWESKGYRGVDGVAWYRRKVTIPQTWVGQQLTLSLGTIDDFDVTYVNGEKIGETAGWNVERTYEVAASANHSIDVSIAVRVTDTGGGGGMVGSKQQYTLSVGGEQPLSLVGDWKMRLEPATEKLGPAPRSATGGNNTPTGLFNAMVNPLIPFKAKGVIWYQGESNGERGKQYQTLFPMLIKNWRDRWQDEMSFYWVQLANYQAPADLPCDSSWAKLREAQSMTLSLPKTGQAVIIDIGEARDIHPKNKQDVGARLARHALAKDYGRSVKYSGPAYKSFAVDGNKIKVSFDFNEGLVSSDGKPLKRFEIAGDDQKFHWGVATIEGNEVVVTCKKVALPTAVRYAWSKNPEGCNLTNETGLPASPFRTDSW